MTYQDAVINAYIQLRVYGSINAISEKFDYEKEAHRIALELKSGGYLDRVSNVFKQMQLSDVPKWREHQGIRGIVPDEQWMSV